MIIISNYKVLLLQWNVNGEKIKLEKEAVEGLFLQSQLDHSGYSSYHSCQKCQVHVNEYLVHRRTYKATLTTSFQADEVAK